jgi:uncharacterized protein YdcH (DUF465 family)
MRGIVASDARMENLRLDPTLKSDHDFSMPIAHHPLINEFPDHRDVIHSLKEENSHFQNLMNSYEDLDKEIFRMEEGIETPADVILTDLKKRRLDLKDQIAGMLREAGSPA